MWLMLKLSFNVKCGDSAKNLMYKRKNLQKFVEDACYTCGDAFEDCEMPKGVWKVFA